MTFTAGHPDAGSALTKQFVAPAGFIPAAIEAGSQRSSAMELSSQAAPQQPEPHTSPTQEVPSFSSEAAQHNSHQQQQQPTYSEKRPRVDGTEEDDLDSSQQQVNQDNHDIAQFLLASLGKPSKESFFCHMPVRCSCTSERYEGWDER